MCRGVRYIGEEEGKGKWRACVVSVLALMNVDLSESQSRAVVSH